MQILMLLLSIILAQLIYPNSIFAATSVPEITNYTSTTLTLITTIASIAAVLFLIRGGFLYITSTGKPDVLDDAKKTIKNALLGLILVIGANGFVSILRGALIGNSETTTTTNLPLAQIETINPSDGLTQVLIDAVNGFIQNLVESATKPIIDGILTLLTTTPELLTNSTIVKFWLIMLGITDTLFVLMIALLGLQLMSASTFGFEEIDFKHLLPRIGIAFLGANVSLFLADYAIKTSNALVSGVISATGGLNRAWIENTVRLQNWGEDRISLIILVFLLLFLIVSIVLLLMYISRFIVIALGAVLSPFIFLLWVLPKTADFAEMAVKSYLVTVFFVFIHVVTIQLAGSFLTLPNNTNNSLISIAVGIGLLLTLVKIPAYLTQLVLFSKGIGSVKHVVNQVSNVLSTKKNDETSKPRSSAKTPRKSINTI